MFGPAGNPYTRKLFEVIGCIQQHEGVQFEVKALRQSGGFRFTMELREMSDSKRPLIPKESKRKAKTLLGEIEKDVVGYTGSCLFVTDDNGGYCNEPVSNNCHISPKSSVLSKLQDQDGKVFELQWGVSQWRRFAFSGGVENLETVHQPATFDPSSRRVVIDHACVGRFACELKRHDNEFQPIDVADPDFDNPEVRFLAAYRLMLFQADQCRLARMLQEQWNRKVMRNPDVGNRLWWSKKVKNLQEDIQKIESTLKLLGKNWHAQKTIGTFDPDLVSVQAMQFWSKLGLAGCVFYGKHTAVSVFPTQGDGIRWAYST